MLAVAESILKASSQLSGESGSVFRDADSTPYYLPQ